MTNTDSRMDRYVAPFRCESCELIVRLALTWKVSDCTHECRRCGEETRHVIEDDYVPEAEAHAYV